MDRCVIYARYSSAGQREESIEGQIRECTDYATRKGWCVVGSYADRALTGTTDRRPEFQKMIKDSERRGFDIVLCWKHDRFARNRYDASIYKAKLKANGVRLAYAREEIADGAQGIIMDSIMEGFAEYYSANLSENVKRGFYESALKRQTIGVRVLGLKENDTKQYELDEANAPLIREIFERYANGEAGKSICDDLNARGYKTIRGYKWRHEGLITIIKNEKYKGVYRFGDIVDNCIPPIVDEELWERANQRRVARQKAPARQDYEGGYILSGKLFCGHCGASMTAESGYSRNGKLYEYYACNEKRKKHCKKKNIPKEFIEDKVVALLSNIIFSDDVINKFAQDYIEWQSHEEVDKGLAELQAREKEISTAMNNLLRSIECGIAVEHVMPRYKELGEQQAQVRKDIADKASDLDVLTESDIIQWLKAFRSGDINSPKWRYFLVKRFLAYAYVWDDGRLIIQMNYNAEESQRLSLEEINNLNFEFGDICPAKCHQFEHGAYFIAASRI